MIASSWKINNRRNVVKQITENCYELDTEIYIVFID